MGQEIQTPKVSKADAERELLKMHDQLQQASEGNFSDAAMPDIDKSAISKSLSRTAKGHDPVDEYVKSNTNLTNEEKNIIQAVEQNISRDNKRGRELIANIIKTVGQDMVKQIGNNSDVVDLSTINVPDRVKNTCSQLFKGTNNANSYAELLDLLINPNNIDESKL